MKPSELLALDYGELQFMQATLLYEMEENEKVMSRKPKSAPSPARQKKQPSSTKVPNPPENRSTDSSDPSTGTVNMGIIRQLVN